MTHHREHKFRLNIRDTINLLCFCSLEIEPTSDFFLRSQHFIILRTSLVNELCDLDSSIFNLDGISITIVLLFGDSKYEYTANKKIISYKF